MLEKEMVISGAGGGKKAEKQRAPIEAPNTLQSNATGQILDLLAFGPIKGIVGGTKGVYLDDTVVENADGSFNFDGIVFEERTGEPDQDIIDGFQSQSNSREINTEIKFDSPAVRTVNNPEASAVIITVGVPQLLKQNTSNGDTNGHSLPLSIHIQRGSTWYSAVSDTISGKNTSPYERSYRIELEGTGPFSIRVQRLNQESENTDTQDTLFWSTMTEVVDVKHSYPYCALAGIRVEARLFGNSLPSRKYLTDLSIIKVPSNYDPETRAYEGLWDGTFKQAWTDNPAWCFYDLATHPIIGAGIEEVNKFALYEIGQYCDELVPDGYGGMEPRFTCNTLFAAQEDAIEALNTLASVFRGMAYWGSNTVEPVADMPQPVRRIVGPSDVLEGEFTYSGTSLKERHSVAVVMWNDPEDGYESKPEMVENAEMIEMVGWREARVTAVACTSRGQARRLGMWILYSEQHETQTLEFATTVKNADLRPGDLIQVQDPYRAGARYAGRVTKVDGNKIFLDEKPSDVGLGWKIVVGTDDKALEQLNVTGYGADYVEVLAVPEDLLPGAGFALVSNSYQMPHFRVVSVSEGQDSTYVVRATEYNPGKYDHIELGMELPDLPESLLPTGQLKAPRSVSAETYRYLEGNSYHQALTIGWEASQDARVGRYILDVKGPGDAGFRTVYTGLGLSFDMMGIVTGTWFIRVRADSEEFGRSAWTDKTIFAENLLVPDPPTALFLQMKTMSATIRPQHPLVGQEFELYRSTVALPAEAIESSSTYVGTGQLFEDTDLLIGTEYHYYARAVNNYGKSGFVHASGSTLADAENILNLLLDQYQQSDIGQWFQKEIDKISGVGPGSVNERLDNIEISVDLDDIEARLDALDQLFQFADYVSESYLKGELVSLDGMLYLALSDVPAGVTPPDPEYWKQVGSYDSLGEVITGLAAQVSAIDTKVDLVDGKLTAQTSVLEQIWSSVDPNMAGSTEDQAGDDSFLAGLYSLVEVVIDGDSAVASRIDVLAAEVNDEIRAGLAAQQQARADLEQAVATDMSSLTARMGASEAAILSEALTRATEDNALSSQIDSMGSRIDSEVGTLQAVIQAESTARANADEALTTQIQAVSSRIDTDVGTTVQAAIQAESTARANADGALATQITNMGTRIDTEVGTLESAIQSEASARVDGQAALTQQMNLMFSDVEENFATIENLNQTKTDLESAAASQFTQLQAMAGAPKVFRQWTAPADPKKGDLWFDTSNSNQPKVYSGTVWQDARDVSISQNLATIQNELTAKVGPEGSITRQVNLAQSIAESKVNTYHQNTAPTTGLVVGDIWYKANEGNKAHRWSGSKWVVTSDESITPALASVQTQVNTLANDVSAQAGQITDVQASVAGQNAAIQQVTQAQATTDGKLNTMWGIKMEVSTSTGQPVYAGVGLGIEGGVSNFTVKADQFRVVQNVNGAETLPFAIQSGKVVLNSAIIGNATIDFTKITDTIQSTNWNASTKTGWRLRKNGQFTIYGGTTGEGYIEINNDGMKVYDSAGRIRVKLGKL